jgi:hypothetical protein
VGSALFTLFTGLALYINSYLFGWEDTNSENEYDEVSDLEIRNEAGEPMGKVSLAYFHGDQTDTQHKVPQLTLQAETHYQSGYIQGYQLASQAEHMLNRLKTIYSGLRALNIFGYKIPLWGDAKWTSQFSQNLPETQREELRGIVAGHNHWAKIHNKPTITLDDLLMLHVLPDTHNIKDLLLTAGILSSGCTAGLTRDADGKIMHFRNTDWPSYNLAGRISLLIDRQIGSKEHSRILTYPLCIGAEYGENTKGLTLSINVSPGAAVLNPKGTLAFLLYRKLLQTCSSVQEVLNKISHDPEYQPLGPCQLTVSDEHDGAIIRFYQKASASPDELGSDMLHFQGKGGYYFSHDITQLSSKEPMLVVANEGLEYHERQLTQGNHHDTKQRIQNVYQMLSTAPVHSIQEAHAALQAPLVMNCESVHTIIKKEGITYVSSRNGYASRFFPVPVGGLLSTDKDEAPLRQKAC